MTMVQGQAGLHGAGVMRPRMELHDDSNVMEPPAKKCTFHGPTLSECLGKEGLEKLRAADLNLKHLAGNEFDGAGDGLKQSGKIPKEGKGGMEATGLGATGNLSGAKESAWQEP